MAVDRIERLYHLTPQGWVDGSVDSMWATHNRKVEPPEDRVETWEHKIYQASPFSREERTWHLVWCSTDASAEYRTALHKKYPHSYDKED